LRVFQFGGHPKAERHSIFNKAELNQLFICQVVKIVIQTLKANKSQILGIK